MVKLAVLVSNSDRPLMKLFQASFTLKQFQHKYIYDMCILLSKQVLFSEDIPEDIPYVAFMKLNQVWGLKCCFVIANQRDRLRVCRFERNLGNHSRVSPHKVPGICSRDPIKNNNKQTNR